VPDAGNRSVWLMIGKGRLVSAYVTIPADWNGKRREFALLDFGNSDSSGKGRSSAGFLSQERRAFRSQSVPSGASMKLFEPHPLWDLFPQEGFYRSELLRPSGPDCALETEA